MIEASAQLSTVGAMQAADATTALTAILNGFKLEASDAADVVDKLTTLDLEAATSSEELAVALQRTASFAESAGVSIDKMLALITTTSETTRLSAKILASLDIIHKSRV